MTSLKVYPNVSEAEQIQYFHSLLPSPALQTCRIMTDTNRAALEDIIATFRRKYVRPNSLHPPDPNRNNYISNTRQTFQVFLEQYQKLAQEAYGDEQPKFIGTSFHAKMPPNLKIDMTQARLESETGDTKVQHLDRDMELNGLSAPFGTKIPGVHQMDVQNHHQQQQNQPKPS